MLLTNLLPLGRKSCWRSGGVEVAPLPVSLPKLSMRRVDHPYGLIRQEIDVIRREADLLAHLPERGLVRRFVAVSPAAKVLPKAVGTAHEGAVLAHGKHAGAREGAVRSDAAVECGVRGFGPRRARASDGARQADEIVVKAPWRCPPLCLGLLR